jgi:hypothetical protein
VLGDVLHCAKSGNNDVNILPSNHSHQRLDSPPNRHLGSAVLVKCERRQGRGSIYKYGAFLPLLVQEADERPSRALPHHTFSVCHIGGQLHKGSEGVLEEVGRGATGDINNVLYRFDLLPAVADLSELQERPSNDLRCKTWSCHCADRYKPRQVQPCST